MGFMPKMRWQQENVVKCFNNCNSNRSACKEEVFGVASESYVSGPQIREVGGRRYGI